MVTYTGKDIDINNEKFHWNKKQGKYVTSVTTKIRPLFKRHCYFMEINH